MRIDLQEGFNNDAVEIYVDGDKVLEREGVTTKRTLGFALSHELDISEETVEIEINVPTQNLSKSFSVDLSDTPYVGISIQNGDFDIIKSRKRFGYA